MKDSHPKEDILESKGTKKNTYTTPHTPHTLHPPEKREPTQIRLRRSIHEAVAKYCGLERIMIGQFYEEAAIMFMDLNPPKAAPPIMVVQRGERGQSLDEELQEIICVDELRDFLEGVRQLKNSLHVTRKKEGITILKNCNKVNNRGEELEALMREAILYIKR